jgi:hypothetical protein
MGHAEATTLKDGDARGKEEAPSLTEAEFRPLLDETLADLDADDREGRIAAARGGAASAVPVSGPWHGSQRRPQ